MQNQLSGQSPESQCFPLRAPHNNIGNMAEQMAAIAISICLGERRGTSAAAEWEDAQRLVMPRRGANR
ncbi:hypothetical protein [Rosistilla oblonga]|uniref:hypothetical protein n=1 Tax=Rosistilla oblonga TaxID=2527990 RepID=UPI003A983ADE